MTRQPASHQGFALALLCAASFALELRPRATYAQPRLNRLPDTRVLVDGALESAMWLQAGGDTEDAFWQSLREDLTSGDSKRVLSALATLEAHKDKPRAARLVNDLLLQGSTTPIVLRALEVVENLGQSSSSTSVALYARHRVVDLRRRAVRCLAKTGGDAAVAGLRRALRDSDQEVRGSAALGLGSLGATDAVPELFAALARQVNEAAHALGLLCLDEDCRQFVGLLGKHPFPVMAPGLEALLLRTDLADSPKLTCIGAVGGLRTRASTALLEGVLERWPKEGSVKVRQALVEAIRDSGGKAEATP